MRKDYTGYEFQEAGIVGDHLRGCLPQMGGWGRGWRSVWQGGSRVNINILEVVAVLQTSTECRESPGRKSISSAWGYQGRCPRCRHTAVFLFKGCPNDACLIFWWHLFKLKLVIEMISLDIEIITYPF